MFKFILKALGIPTYKALYYTTRDQRDRYEALYARADAQTNRALAIVEQLRGMSRRQDAIMAHLRREITTRSGSYNTQFDQDEIRTLVALCHPDKHGGKSSAQNMTKKLLAMRPTMQ